MEQTLETQYMEVLDIERIITEYGDSLLRMCTIYLKDYSLAEDAVQDTLIKVYQNYSKFNNESSEKTWIMRIAINTCHNYLRTSWFRKVTTGINLDSTAPNNIEGNLLEVEQQKLILNEVMQLSYKYKEVILLYYYQDFSIKEISQVLSITEGSVKVRLQRARKKLSIQLTEVK